MKTTNKLTRFRDFTQHKLSLLNLCLASFLLMIVLLLGGCQKNINDVPATANTSSNESDLFGRYNASVATDWYKLQLRFLLEKNSSLPSGVYFGYIGIGLYEAVRYSMPN